MQVVRFHDSLLRADRVQMGCYRIAIAEEGRTLVHLVFIEDTGVRKASLPRDDMRTFECVEHKGRAYPVARAARKMRETGRRLGITEGAKAQLKQAEAEA